MKSYRELAPLASRLSGIFCDVDDTLTHHGVLVPAAYEAIARATEAGLRVVAVTGRPAGWAEVFACTWPIAGAIAENGAFAVRRAPSGRSVERMTWDDADRAAAARASSTRSRDASCPRFPARGSPTTSGCAAATSPSTSARRRRWRPRSSTPSPRASVTRARAASPRRCTRTRSSATTTRRRCASASRAAFSNVDLAATRGDWLFVGDSPNDQPCFSYFPVAAGVANVRRYLDRLTPPPGYVADGEGGFGFAEIVSLLLANR